MVESRALLGMRTKLARRQVRLIDNHDYAACFLPNFPKFSLPQFDDDGQRTLRF